MNQVALRQPDTVGIPEELKKLYMDLYFKGLSENDATIMYRIAKKKGLDIESNQIRFLPYKNKEGVNKPVPQVSIDGFRLVAFRSGKYGGSVNPRLTVKLKDGSKAVIPHEEYDPEDVAYIISGTIDVINTEFPNPQSATALFRSYAKTYNGNPTGLWATMPDVMILKCAESLALRRAFPHDLSGLYTNEEMEQARNDNSFEPAPIALEAPKTPLNKFKPKAKQVEVKPEAQEPAIEAEVIEVKPSKAKIAETETMAEYIAKIPDRLRTMNPEIDEDAIDLCRIRLMDHFAVANPEEIPEDRFEDVREYMRNDVVSLLKEYGFL